MAFFRLFDMGFQCHRALRLCQLEHRVEHDQQLDIGIFFVFCALQDARQLLHRCFEDVAVIADDVGTNGGTKDDDVLEGLPQHEEMAAVQRVTAKHTSEDYRRANQ